jgi:hypothetical protein
MINVERNMHEYSLNLYEDQPEIYNLILGNFHNYDCINNYILAIFHSTSYVVNRGCNREASPCGISKLACFTMTSSEEIGNYRRAV